jgi:hypothetical protein
MEVGDGQGITIIRSLELIQVTPATEFGKLHVVFFPGLKFVPPFLQVVTVESTDKETPVREWPRFRN